jgi:hypothetical protein
MLPIFLVRSFYWYFWTSFVSFLLVSYATVSTVSLLPFWPFVAWVISNFSGYSIVVDEPRRRLNRNSIGLFEEFYVCFFAISSVRYNTFSYNLMGLTFWFAVMDWVLSIYCGFFIVIDYVNFS